MDGPESAAYSNSREQAGLFSALMSRCLFSCVCVYVCKRVQSNVCYAKERPLCFTGGLHELLTGNIREL